MTAQIPSQVFHLWDGDAVKGTLLEAICSFISRNAKYSVKPSLHQTALLHERISQLWRETEISGTRRTVGFSFIVNVAAPIKMLRVCLSTSSADGHWQNFSSGEARFSDRLGVDPRCALIDIHHCNRPLPLQFTARPA